jgi:NTE family protein
MHVASPIASSRSPPRPPAQTKRPVTLALQGGGALGAFTWGVLDRLLEEPRLRIAVASGTSAGAMNAAMLVQGLAAGGPEDGPAEAKRLLEAMWRRVAVAAGSPDIDGADWLRPFLGLLCPVADALRHAARELPPSRLPPSGPNPIRGVLDGLLDPSVFGKEGAPTLVVSATRVRTGEARLFWNEEVTADVLLASACLPQLFAPVEIDGEPYWDGAYASNPPLRPLIEAGAPADVILVPTGPAERPEPPHGAADIRERAAEIAFNTALRQELRTLATAQRLLAELPDPPPPGTGLARLREARLHVIGADEAFLSLPGGSALDARWGFLRKLRDLGRDSAERWLGENLAAVGVRPTLDLARFAGPVVELRAEEERLPPPEAQARTAGRRTAILAGRSAPREQVEELSAGQQNAPRRGALAPADLGLADLPRSAGTATVTGGLDSRDRRRAGPDKPARLAARYAAAVARKARRLSDRWHQRIRTHRKA